MPKQHGSTQTNRGVSVCVPREEPERNGPGEDLQVEQERPVLDVVEVVFDALLDAGVAAQAVDLRPAGHSALHHVAKLVARDSAAELIDEDGALRPRADEAHVAGEDV